MKGLLNQKAAAEDVPSIWPWGRTVHHPAGLRPFCELKAGLDAGGDRRASTSTVLELSSTPLPARSLLHICSHTKVSQLISVARLH